MRIRSRDKLFPRVCERVLFPRLRRVANFKMRGWSLKEAFVDIHFGIGEEK